MDNLSGLPEWLAVVLVLGGALLFLLWVLLPIAVISIQKSNLKTLEQIKALAAKIDETNRLLSIIKSRNSD